MSALENAFILIKKAVEHQAEGLNFTTLNEDSGIPQGSAHRLVKELVRLRILDYDEQRKLYRGGLALASLGAQIVSHYDLRQVARPSLESLHDKLGNVVTLGIRDETSGIYIDKIEASDMRFRLHSEIGKSFPLHCTAMGKVLLANAETTTQQSVLKKKLPQLTPNTITDVAELRATLGKVYEQGFAIDDEEITRGLICAAAPIYNVNGDVTGALSFTCQKHRFNEIGSDVIIRNVRQAAASASAQFAGN